MTTAATGLVNLVTQYDALLQRYARRITRNQAVASILVMQVIEQYYFHQLAQSLPSAKYLKELVRQAAYTWLYNQVNSIALSNLITNAPIPNSQFLSFNALFAKKPKNPV